MCHIRTEYPDVLGVGGAVLQKPATRRVEKAVALERSETLELGSKCVRLSSVEWRALGNVRWV